MKKIPTTIITGFLGSGKTTIIQNSIKSVWEQERVALIKNEISDVGVDSLELQDPKLEITELDNGCICCTLVGALNEAVEKIIKSYKPDRIIIEASGLAKPASIVIGLELVKNVVIDGVIVVIDTLNYKSLTEIEKSWSGQVQTQFTDLYILNKVDQVTEGIIDDIKDDILGIKPSARIIETSDANIPGTLILGLNHTLSNLKDLDEHDHSEYESFILENFEVDDLENFQEMIGNLPKNIYRAKGYFSFENKNYILNMVAGNVSIREINKSLPQKSKMVFIGKDILKYQNLVEKNSRLIIN